MPTVITVEGRFAAWYPAERATVNLTISFDGPERGSVTEAATASVRRVTDGIAALHDPEAGPVTRWSSDRIRIWADRPWNSDGKQLKPVHHAAMSVSARFRDFDVLAEWIAEVVAVPGVHIGGIEWGLTKEHRASATTEARSRAVQDAADKALVFARAIGLTTVTATAIADPGMLGVGGAGHDGYAIPMGRARAAAPAASFEFTPEEIEVSASVDARFDAS